MPAYGPNGTWYSNRIYMRPDSEQRKHHEATWGPITEFGYKDFIPLFTAEHFDADEWAELFEKAGARFAGPVAEHHDGFAMWDTKWSRWNAAQMGPKRDVVGELEEAIKKRGMKFVTAFHHAANWFFFPVWDERYDTSNPEYSGLYGPIHEEGEKPSREFLEEWHGKLIEVVDTYEPDFVWFDFALEMIHESYVKDFLAHYYNQADALGKEVVVTYKDHDLPAGVGLVDLELGQERELTHHEWITDTSVDDQGAWSYVSAAGFKSADRLIDNLVDRVSKNGYLLLNVGPKPDGTIPDEARELLLEIGAWLEVNGEAIYGTTPWFFAGEGPTDTRQGRDVQRGRSEVHGRGRPLHRSRRVSCTRRSSPGPARRRRSRRLGRGRSRFPGLYESEIESITMLGSEGELDWKLTDEALVIRTPPEKPGEHAFVFKIVRKAPHE